jgi:hypothetical protein
MKIKTRVLPRTPNKPEAWGYGLLGRCERFVAVADAALYGGT